MIKDLYISVLSISATIYGIDLNTISKFCKEVIRLPIVEERFQILFRDVLTNH